MAFPNIQFGDYGDELRTSSINDFGVQFGQLMMLPGGELYRFAKAGSLALSPGKLAQQAVVQTGHTKDLAVYAAAAAEDSSVRVTSATTIITKDMYTDGYLFVNDAAGEGQQRKIKSHSVGTATNSVITFTLHPNQPLKVALTTSSEVGLRKSPWDGLLVCPTTQTGVVAGLTVVDVTAAYYCWVQLAGPVCVLTNGTVVVGKGVIPSTTTPGAVDVAATNTDYNVLGYVMSVAASTEYSLVMLNILP